MNQAERLVAQFKVEAQIRSLEAQITLAQLRIERIGEELDTLKRKRLECEDKIAHLSRLIEMAQTISTTQLQ